MSWPMPRDLEGVSHFKLILLVSHKVSIGKASQKDERTRLLRASSNTFGAPGVWFLPARRLW